MKVTDIKTFAGHLPQNRPHGDRHHPQQRPYRHGGPGYPH